MMKIDNILALLPLLALPLAAPCAHAQQSVEEALEIVERNSPVLKAASARLEYETLSNASVKYLDSPEFGFNYLWGQGPGGGIRRDFSISQSFDLPALTGMRRRLARAEDGMSMSLYEAKRRDVMSRAREACSDIVYYNALIAGLEDYQSLVQGLCEAAERKSALGEADALSLASARLQLSTVRSKLSRARSDRMGALSELRALGDSSTIDIVSTRWPYAEELPDFDSWYGMALGRDPDLRYVSSEMQSAALQFKMDKMSWVPALSVGYMAELAPEDKYRGMTFGISIPIWSGGNRVKRSAAAVRYTSAQHEALEQSASARLRKTWQTAVTRHDAAVESRAALESADPRGALSKLLDSGSVSVMEYILALGMYYDALEQTLLDERDSRAAWIELQKCYL